MNFKSNIKKFCLDLKSQIVHSNTASLAAASSFYFILTVVPFLLLVTRVVGLFMGEKGQRFDEMIIYLTQFIPPHLDGVFSIITDVVKQSMFYDRSLSLLNFLFLLLSSLGFVNSIWQAIAHITNDEAKTSKIKNSMKGVVLMLMTSLFFVLLFLVPILLNFLASLISNIEILKYTDFFKLGQVIDVLKDLAVKTNLLTAASLVLFMILVFRFLLLGKVRNLSSIIGALFYIVLLVLLKSLFFYYVGIVKSGLLTNYGTFYGIILFLLWIQASIYSFYLSLQVSLSLEKTIFVGQDKLK